MVGDDRGHRSAERRKDGDAGYEPPAVRDIDTTEQPAFTEAAAGTAVGIIAVSGIGPL